jgi:hypothetical protein
VTPSSSHPHRWGRLPIRIPSPRPNACRPSTVTAFRKFVLPTTTLLSDKSSLHGELKSPTSTRAPFSTPCTRPQPSGWLPRSGSICGQLLASGVLNLLADIQSRKFDPSPADIKLRIVSFAPNELVLPTARIQGSYKRQKTDVTVVQEEF